MSYQRIRWLENRTLFSTCDGRGEKITGSFAAIEDKHNVIGRDLKTDFVILPQ